MATVDLFCVILTFLLIKHFLADFPLHNSKMYSTNEGYPFGWGLLHTAIHGLLTFVVLIYLSVSNPLISIGVIMFAVSIDTCTHYYIDYGKADITIDGKWTFMKGNDFKEMFGLDQLLHQLVYVLIAYFVVKSIHM